MTWPQSRVQPVLVSGEDTRERLCARLREIMTAMELTPNERHTVLERIRVVDLVGKRFRLSELDRHGNVETSADVDRFIQSFAPLKPGLVIFDPLASFGAPEETVNSSAQGSVNAARRIVRELGCCVRLIHHTGQAVLRDNITDQYAPRGGSALSDGARMVAVLGRTEDSPFPEKDGVFVLVRAKNNYCRPQPRIFVRRMGFVFDYLTEIVQTDEQRLRAIEDQVWTFPSDQLKSARKYSRNTLDDVRHTLKVSRDTLRQAVTALIMSGRLEEKELEKAEQIGAKKTYLHPVSISRLSARDIPRDTPKPATYPQPSRGVDQYRGPLRKNVRRDIGGGHIPLSFPNLGGEVRDIPQGIQIYST
ncbi:MAG: AAA family ATPase [Gammaproteobacteria bacterium]